MRTTNIDALIQACEYDLEIVAQEARIIHVLLIGPLREEEVVSFAEAWMIIAIPIALFIENGTLVTTACRRPVTTRTTPTTSVVQNPAP